jgi:predicted amino acid-binding ACT domain protein
MEVVTLLRLRISVPDRPGALARVATIIASHGGNITSIDVQQVDAEFAVDELVVDFTDPPDVARLREDLATQGDTTLLSHQQTERIDPIVASLRQAIALVEMRSEVGESALARGVAELCSSPVAWVSSAEEATEYDAGRLALERQGMVIMTTTELPAHLAERLPGEVCLLALPDHDPAEQQRVIFVARPVANSFTTTEAARVEALAALHTAVARILGPG